MPGETKVFYYALTDANGKITSNVEDNVMIYSEYNKQFVSVRYGSNKEYTMKDGTVEFTFFTTIIPTNYGAHFYETMTIQQKNGQVDTFFAAYEEKDSEKDSSTTSDKRDVKFYKESSSTNKYSYASVDFKTDKGRKVRTVRLMDNEMDNEMKEMEKEMKEMMKKMKENMNEMEKNKKEMKKKKGLSTGGLSMGLLRSLFD